MRRILLAFMSTLAAVVVLFGYRTSTSNPPRVATTTIAGGSTGVDRGTATTLAAPPSGSPQTSPNGTRTTATNPNTVIGQAAQTRYGPVQVQITVTGGKIKRVDLLQVPSTTPRDDVINNFAVPKLKHKTLQAQSAQIDSVSGATETSTGYINSLQSALDQAGL